MAQPDDYAPAHSFVADSANIPDFPGQNLDVEFAALAAVLAEYHTNLALIQRDDGALANGIVTADSLDAALTSALGDVISTAADVISTHADVVLTHADVVTTGTRVTAAAASATAAAASAVAAAASAAATGISGLTNHGVGIANAATSLNTSVGLTDGQLLVGATGATPTAKTLSGDGTLSAAGALTVTKTGGAAFATSATTDTTSATNITAGTLALARGGTGSGTQAGARTALGLTPTVVAAFRAHKNGASQASFPAASYTKVTFGTAAVNVGSFYSTANSQWTPPAGPILLNAFVWVSAGFPQSGSPTIVAKILKNGGDLTAGIGVAQLGWAAPGPAIVGVTGVDVANGTDVYEVDAFIDSATTTTIDGNAAHTYFQGVTLS